MAKVVFKSGAKVQEVNPAPGVRVTASSVPKDFVMTVEALEFKSGMEPNVEHPKGSGIYPVANLDIVLASVSAVSKRIHAPSWKLPQVVFTVMKNAHPACKVNKVYIWFKRQWVDVKSGTIPGIGKVTSGPKGISFEVTDWPVDDRMIGCG